MKRIAIVVAGLAVFCACIAGAETKADDVVGVYFTQGKDCKIEIYKENDKYNGKIVWLKDPNYGASDNEAGKPQRDRSNPDTARQNDPMLGLNLLKGFSFDGTSNWNGGTIYDPTNGKTYKCTMKFTDPKTLDVHGYIGIPALGRSETWTRAEEKAEATQAASTTTTQASAEKKLEKKN